jgi:uncharacterized protein
MIVLFMVSIVCAVCFGFATQHGGLCVVSGIADVLDHRSTRVFLSFFRISVWVALVTIPICWLYSASHLPMVYAPDLAVIAGGFMFGIGAAVNGGCSFGTLIRFGAGELSFIASFIGMAIGVWLQRHLLMSADPFPKGLSVLAHPSWPGLVLLGIIALFCLRELVLLPGWKGAGSRSPEQAAMAIGLAGGALYIFNGPWPYMVAFDQLVNRSRPNQLHGLVLAGITFATLAGATLGAMRNNMFRIHCQWRLLPLRILGGVMMGFGAALIPGGNGVLVLHAFPALSPHAVPAYIALILGVGASLLVSRFLRRSAHLPTPFPARFTAARSPVAAVNSQRSVECRGC